MSLLDFDETYVAPFKAKEQTYKGKKIDKTTALSQESRDGDLNNFDRKKNTEDFADSPFSDRRD